MRERGGEDERYMDEMIATFVQRVDGHTDRWEDALPVVMFDEGIARIERNQIVLAYYAAGQWITVYTETAQPLREQ